MVTAPTTMASAASVTPDERNAKCMVLKATLEQAGDAIPEEVRQALVNLDKEMAPKAATLSHRHLTQVQKWTAKVEAHIARLRETDGKWSFFKQEILTLWKDQAEIYKDQRLQQATALKEAKAKLEQAKIDAQDAMAHLAGKPLGMEDPPEDTEIPQILTDSDTEKGDAEEQMGEETNENAARDGRSRSPVRQKYSALAPFRKLTPSKEEKSEK